jgi:hypothetical protein
VLFAVQLQDARSAQLGNPHSIIVVRVVVHRYDPATGRASSCLSRTRQPTAGVGCRVRTREAGRIFAALYVESGALWLGLGAGRCNLDSGAFTVDHPIERGRCVFSFNATGMHCSYSYRDPAHSLWAFMDPTYDAIDRDSDDFLWFVARTIADPWWRDSAKRTWADRAGAT